MLNAVHLVDFDKGFFRGHYHGGSPKQGRRPWAGASDAESNAETHSSVGPIRTPLYSQK
jgi:hypothetical protein